MKYRNLIGEGPDGGGKSTTLRIISKIINREIYHTGGPIHTRNDYFRMIDESENKLKTHILDRTPHISENVYSILRNGMLINKEEYSEVLDSLKVLNPVILYCKLDPAEMISKIVQDGKEGYKPKEHYIQMKENYERIAEEYDKVISFLEEKFDIIYFNYKTDKIEEIIDQLKDTK